MRLSCIPMRPIVGECKLNIARRRLAAKVAHVDPHLIKGFQAAISRVPVLAACPNQFEDLRLTLCWTLCALGDHYQKTSTLHRPTDEGVLGVFVIDQSYTPQIKNLQGITGLKFPAPLRYFGFRSAQLYHLLPILDCLVQCLDFLFRNPGTVQSYSQFGMLPSCQSSASY